MQDLICDGTVQVELTREDRSMSKRETVSKPYYLIDVPMISNEVVKSFDDLCFDNYLGTKQRYRRFSQFKVRVGEDGFAAEKLPHRPFIQGGNYNKLYGPIKRYYEPIEANVIPVIEYCTALVPIERDKDYLIRTHQFRTIVTRDITGSCVPEGPHRDGVDYGVMVCVDRRNVTGGETQISFRVDAEPVFSQVVQPNTAIVIKDKEIYHNVTNIELVDGADFGYRDMLFWGFIPWEQGRYGKVHENALAAGLAIDY
jgi:hypothetical protein